jgi:hypothetical protein
MNGFAGGVVALLEPQDPGGEVVEVVEVDGAGQTREGASFAVSGV